MNAQAATVMAGSSETIGLTSDTATTLLDNFKCCLLKEDSPKRPHGINWQNRPRKPSEWKPGTGIGVICGTIDGLAIHGLDVDAKSEVIADQMREHIRQLVALRPGKKLIRVGLPPKFLIPFTMKEPIRKQLTAAYYPDGDESKEKNQIEILGTGNQFVAYQIHPETKQPYEWFDLETGELDDLHNYKPSDLVQLTQADLDEIKSLFIQFAIDEGLKVSDKETKARTAQPNLFRRSTPEDAGIIDKVNNDHRTMSDILKSYGYEQKDKNRHLYPRSSTGDPGVVVFIDGDKERCYSHHASDPLSDGHSHDKFSVITVLGYDGNATAAIRALANKIDPEGQKERQKEFMQEKSSKEPEELLPVINGTAEKTPDSPHKPRFKLTAVNDLLKTPEPLHWLIKSYLLPQTNVEAFGESEAGKSLLMIDWSACIATGRNWNGHAVKQGGVIYLAGEGHHGIRRRLLAWAIHNNAEAELVAAPLVVSEKGAALNKETELAEVMEAVDAIAVIYGNPVLIVVDTLHRNMSGDENSASDMGEYYKAVDALKLRYGATIVTAHHTGHGDKDRSRGSSAIKPALDTQYHVNKKGEGAFTLISKKMKDAPKPAPTNWEIKVIELPWLDTDGERETSVVIMPTDQKVSTARKMTPTIKHALESFFDAATMDELSDVSAERDQWRNLYYQTSTADNDEAKKKAFLRARNTLKADGVLTVNNDVYTLISGTFAYSDLAELIRERMLTMKHCGTALEQHSECL